MKTFIVRIACIALVVMASTLSVSAQQTITPEASTSAVGCNPPCPAGERCENGECVGSGSAAPAAATLKYGFWGIYINGKKVQTKQEVAQFKSYIASCPKAQSAYNTGNMIMIPFYIFGGASLVFDAMSMASSFSGSPNLTPILYSFGCIALMVPFGIGAGAKYNEATRIYNAQQCAADAPNLKLGVKFSGNGLALALDF